MQVSIKDLAVSMRLGNKGILLDVYDNAGTHLAGTHAAEPPNVSTPPMVVVPPMLRV